MFLSNCSFPFAYEFAIFYLLTPFFKVVVTLISPTLPIAEGEMSPNLSKQLKIRPRKQKLKNESRSHRLSYLS
jgi:hypothetical protein